MTLTFSGSIRYMKIYSDVRCTELQQKLREVTQPYKPVVRELIPTDSVESASSATAPRTFMEMWESEELELDDVHNKVHKLDEFHCFVTDQQTIADADVAYALFHKAIPVLSLVNSSPLQPASGTRARSATSISPLYHTLEMLNVPTEVEALEKFFTFSTKPGRVFVFEGGDGAGKQTQTELMVQRLRAEGRKVATLDFPNDKARYGTLIREILYGKYGGFSKLNPMMFAALYGLNRHDTLPLLRLWLQRGCNVVLDRYMTANFGFQASKAKTDRERSSAVDALEAFETVYLSLPRPDAVAYLDVPPAFAHKAMMADTTRGELDMYERMALDRKEEVRQAFLWCCDKLLGWYRFDCLNGKGTSRLPREVVHEQVYKVWKDLFV